MASRRLVQKTLAARVTEARRNLKSAKTEALLAETDEIRRMQVQTMEDVEKMIPQVSNMVNICLRGCNMILRSKQATTKDKHEAYVLVLKAARLHNDMITNAICFEQARGKQPVTQKPKNQPPSFVNPEVTNNNGNATASAPELAEGLTDG